MKSTDTELLAGVE